MDLLRRGVGLGDFVTRSAEVRALGEGEADVLWLRVLPIRVRKFVLDFWVEIKISEGKSRQVRRMTAKAGFPRLRLVRVAIGRPNLSDLNLELGQWRLAPYCP